MAKVQKKLPAYEAETRIDSIAGFALPEILFHERQLKVTLVIPELPLRIGTVQPKKENSKYANRSYKVDFFVVTTCGKNLLVEFKTDSDSRRGGQDEHLADAKREGAKKVISGILQLRNKSDYKKKYNHLVEKLANAGLVKPVGDEYAPCIENDELEILYIQPRVKKSDVGLDILDFEAVAKAIEHEFSGDDFMLAAAETFRSWASD
jgi:hypothetical protein